MLAFNLSNWPVSILAQPLRRIPPAAFSALQGDRPRMNAAMEAIVVVLASATLPITLFLAGIAVPLVEFVYGEAWVAAAAAISWLVIAACCRVFATSPMTTLWSWANPAQCSPCRPEACWCGSRCGGRGLLGRAGWTRGGPGGRDRMRRSSPVPMEAEGAWVGPQGHPDKTPVPLAAGLATGVAARILAMTVTEHLVALFTAGTIAALVTAGLLYLQRDHIRELRSIGKAATVEATV